MVHSDFFALGKEYLLDHLPHAVEYFPLTFKFTQVQVIKERIFIGSYLDRCNLILYVIDFHGSLKGSLRVEHILVFIGFGNVQERGITSMGDQGIPVFTFSYDTLG